MLEEVRQFYVWRNSKNNESMLMLIERGPSDVHWWRSHSLSFDHRFSARESFTAIAKARRWPTSTTSCLARVTPV